MMNGSNMMNGGMMNGGNMMPAYGQFNQQLGSQQHFLMPQSQQYNAMSWQQQQRAAHQEQRSYAPTPAPRAPTSAKEDYNPVMAASEQVSKEASARVLTLYVDG